ncbi:MAG: sulfatase [Polyangiaceae bacterium]|nr:sulfatase [Polyangiaceae bacterium]
MRTFAAASLLAVLATAGCAGEKHEAGASSTGEPAKPPTPGDQTAAAQSAGPAAAPGSAAPKADAAAGDIKNVLVLSIDSLRADRMAFSGHDAGVMPTLNAFEKTAVSYTKFSTLSSYTAQTLGGFLGARYPSELKRSGYFFASYPDDEILFPELLQKGGIRTMSAHAHFYFNKDKAGFHQGFDVYDIVPDLKKNNTTDENITSPAHTEIILKHLADKANTGNRFFAFYHLLDPHDQYMGHPEGKDFGKGAKNLYDGELYFTDMHVKKVLDYVDSQPWGKNTMVIITSDHGETFGEHKMYRHGFELWNVLTHVPLMIRAPGIKPRRIDTPRSMIDVPATIMDALGVQPDPSFHGTSLMAELKGGDAPARDVITDLARTSDNDRRRTLTRGNWRLIELGDGDGYQLFDLSADPGEENDLARKEKAKLEEMRAALKEATKGFKEVCPKMTEKLKGKKKGKAC